VPAADDLFSAVRSGDEDRVKELVDARPELAEARDANGVSVVLCAAYASHDSIVDMLLGANPALDVFDSAAVGRTRGLEELLETEPALARSVSPDGSTPLHLAARFGNEEAAKLLIEHGADAAATDADGFAPAQRAREAGHEDLASFVTG
jgi:hypothetical protein